MRTVIALALLGLTALPAHADVQEEIANGIYACLVGNGNPNTTYAALSEIGWEGDVDNEAGIGYVYPPNAEDPTVTIGMDGTWCNVESASVGSEEASNILRPILEETYDIEYNKTDMGCTQFGLGDGVGVTVLSGGNDPICGAETNSSLLFEYNLQ